jgi:protein O-mannosyl-transferase
VRAPQSRQKKSRQQTASMTLPAKLAPSAPFWGLALLLVVVTFVAYYPATNCGYVWDDDFYVQNNQTLRSASGLGQIWFKLRATPQYYPAVFTSYWLEYRLWGLNPTGYHFVNVLLHAAGAVLLWRILSLLQLRGAWLAAALFALHPVQVESVAWITERKNVLSGVFYFAAALVYLRAALSPKGRVSAGRYAAFLLLFLCALLSKTVTCTLPAALLLVLWWKRGRLRWKDILPLGPLFLLGMASGLLTAWMEKGHVGAVGEDWNLSFLDRCLIAGRVICFYATKLVWPHPLIFTYPRWQIDATAWWQYLYPLAVVAAIVGFWLSRRRLGRGPLVALLFFAGTLFPALGFFNVYPMLFSFVADHFQYLASVGLLALFAAAACRLADLRRWSGKPAAAIPVVFVLAVLGTLTWCRCLIYQNEETLWRDTLKRNPAAWIAHSNMVPILINLGKLDEAESQCREALHLRPACREAYYNLGSLRILQDRLDDAVTCFRQAARLAPDDGAIHVSLGAALHAQGRLDEAIDEYRRALHLAPENSKALRQLGAALQSQGKVDEAVGLYQRVLQIDPADAETHCNLGVALMAQSKPDEAVAHYRRSLQLNPNAAYVHFALGAALQSQNKLDEAISSYQSALRIKPDHPQAHYGLAAALESQGKLEQALPHYLQAMQGDSSWVDPMIRAAWILATHPDAGLGQPEEAVRLAERAADLTRRQDADVLDILAATYAAAGRFDQAVATAQAALQLAAELRIPALTDRISRRLELYKQRVPYREDQPARKPPIP